MRHFGCGIYRTITELIDGEAHIEDTLRKLSDAGLIDCQAGDWVFLTKTAKSQFVSKNSDLSPVPRRPYRGLPPRD
jgi:hypothetical protein